MKDQVQPFQPEAIEQLAQIIGDNYSGTEITRLFRRAGFPQIVHDGTTKWRFVDRALNDLQTRSGNRPHSTIKVIEALCNPQQYVEQRDRFDSVLQHVNAVLEFYGCRVRQDGKVVATGERVSTVRQTKTPDEIAFDARGFHSQVVMHARSHFARGSYFHAVFECCKAFDTAVRDNTHIDKSGQPLMSAAMNPNGPLKLNSQRTQSEKDEQEGVMYLCMGLMNAVRNPQAHEPELNWPMTREDALDALALLSFLFRKLEHAMVVPPGGAPARVRL
jgi:uncharacterized protein (TIGR02391 family)